MTRAHNRLDLMGQKFGSLTDHGEAPSRKHYTNRSPETYWICSCSCGNTCEVQTKSLRSGNTMSCGCLRREVATKRATKHGIVYTRYYSIWNGMMFRCYNPKAQYYHCYGGRGIYVCKEWHDPKVFAEWCKTQEPIPHDFSLDRFPDMNGPYSPTNCRFASRKEQSSNTRRNVFVEYKGERLTFTELVEKHGAVSYETARARYRRGWDAISAVTIPLIPPEIARGLPCKR